MKRALLAILFVASLTVTSQAQNRKFWVSGSFGFSSAEIGSNTSQNAISIQPNLGYFFSDHWAVGIRFGLEHSKLKTGNTTDIQRFSVAPFARYVFMRWKALTLFVDGGVDFSDVTDSEDGVVEDARLSSFGFFVKPGFSVRLTDRFSLVGNTNFFSANYAQSSIGPRGDKTKTFAAGLNSPLNLDNFTLGFSFKF